MSNQEVTFDDILSKTSQPKPPRQVSSKNHSAQPLAGMHSLRSTLKNLAIWAINPQRLQFPFQLLPLEIRELIYAHALPALVELNVTSNYSAHAWRGHAHLTPRRRLAILSVSKDIHNEAKAFMYKTHPFSLHIDAFTRHDISSFYRWLEHGSLSLQIQSITIYTANRDADQSATVYHEVQVVYQNEQPAFEQPRFRSSVQRWGDDTNGRMRRAKIDLERACGPRVGLWIMRDERLREQFPAWNAEMRLRKMVGATSLLTYEWDEASLGVVPAGGVGGT